MTPPIVKGDTVMNRIWVVLILAVLVIIGISAFNKSKQTTTTSGGSTTATVNIQPTFRSLTVSPGNVTFANCHLANQSTSSLLGLPNGECTVGKPGSHGTYPITVANAGVPSTIEVSASNAIPADNGKQWQLCNPDGKPACTGTSGNPGPDQYKARTISSGQQNTAMLTASPLCDNVFDATGGCSAARGQSQQEGIKLVGPTTISDNSTSFTITITWIAVAP